MSIFHSRALTIALVLLAAPAGAQTGSPPLIFLELPAKTPLLSEHEVCSYQTFPEGTIGNFGSDCSPEMIAHIQADAKAKAPATQADIAELRAVIERLTSLIERDQDIHAK